MKKRSNAGRKKGPPTVVMSFRVRKEVSKEFRDNVLQLINKDEKPCKNHRKSA